MRLLPHLACTLAPDLKTDIAIIGGGIAGVWVLNLLRARGVDCMLFERDALGSGQTIASQGMIHGGIKYALGGALTGSSEAIAIATSRHPRFKNMAFVWPLHEEATVLEAAIGPSTRWSSN